MRFGTQRAPGEIVSLILLFAGFAALAVAFRILNDSWLGLLLPLGFLAGTWQSMRVDVREIELRPEALVVRTFFREYALPRANLTGFAITPGGVAVNALNGSRYAINPSGVDPDELHRIVTDWLATGAAS